MMSAAMCEGIRNKKKKDINPEKRKLADYEKK